MSDWHKCHICDTEYYDPTSAGYWGRCPSCRDVTEPRPVLVKRAKPRKAKAEAASKSN